MRFPRLIVCLFYFLFVSFAFSIGQSFSRSGFPAEQESLSDLRRFPCGGETLLNQNFEQPDSVPLPMGWKIEDVDGFAPNNNILFLTPEKGWQRIIDFKDADSLNHAMASPSWYENTDGGSDDYLITRQIQNLPENVCLSWYAYSQDKFFPESYEIRVSTTTADPAAFLLNEPAAVIGEEGDEFTFRTADLSAYAGQDIYIAFRHTSLDKFILVLDDIRVAEVEAFDIAMFNVDEINAAINDQIQISGSFINRGLDTLEIDTLTQQVQIHYQIDSDPVKTIDFGRVELLLPNDTLQFSHDSLWVPTENAVYKLRVWVDGFGMDDNVVNDTLGRWQGIGTRTSLSEPEITPFKIYPNPVSETLKIEIAIQQNWTISTFDLFGRSVLPQQEITPGSSPYSLDVRSLPRGIYLIQLQDGSGKSYATKFQKE